MTSPEPLSHGPPGSWPRRGRWQRWTRHGTPRPTPWPEDGWSTPLTRTKTLGRLQARGLTSNRIGDVTLLTRPITGALDGPADVTARPVRSPFDLRTILPGYDIDIRPVLDTP